MCNINLNLIEKTRETTHKTILELLGYQKMRKIKIHVTKKICQMITATIHSFFARLV
jgi:hypothetical protein